MKETPRMWEHWRTDSKKATSQYRIGKEPTRLKNDITKVGGEEKEESETSNKQEYIKLSTCSFVQVPTEIIFVHI